MGYLLTKSPCMGCGSLRAFTSQRPKPCRLRNLRPTGAHYLQGNGAHPFRSPLGYVPAPTWSAEMERWSPQSPSGENKLIPNRAPQHSATCRDVTCSYQSVCITFIDTLRQTRKDGWGMGGRVAETRTAFFASHSRRGMWEMDNYMPSAWFKVWCHPRETPVQASQCTEFGVTGSQFPKLGGFHSNRGFPFPDTRIVHRHEHDQNRTYPPIRGIYRPKI